MFCWLRFALFASIFFTYPPSLAADEKPLKINGSTTVNLIATEAAEILTQEKGIQIFVDTQGGSSGGISTLAEGVADVGMISRPLTEEDRQKYPACDFVATQVGVDAVALVVSRDVYDGGVRALSRDEVQAIYEKKIVNWKDLGGPDLGIVFFNKEPGRGTWEVFAHWLYGNPKKAPPTDFPEVGGNEEARTKVATTRGAITQLSAAWAENRADVAALAIRLDDGSAVSPTPENIASGKYPLSRPLNFVTRHSPDGAAKTFLDFVLSDRGQDVVRKNGYLAIRDLQNE